MNGDEQEPLVDPKVAAMALSVGVVGWITTVLSPESGQSETVAMWAAGGAVVLLGLYALWRAYQRSVAEAFEEPLEPCEKQASGLISPSSPGDAPNASDQSSNDWRTAYQRRNWFLGYPSGVFKWLPLCVLIAVFPLVYGWDGSMQVPGIGIVPVPWYGFPIAGAVLLYLSYRLFIALSSV